MIGMRYRLTTAAVARGAAAAVALTTTLAGCQADDGTVTRGTLTGQVHGSGATFPNPIFQEWIRHYTSSIETGVSIDYDSIGSGGGIEQFLQQTVDFGSSERYLEESELQVAQEVRGCPAVQFPVLFGSDVIAFNDPELDGMVLTAEAIARIYDRQIVYYDDPALVELNPEMDLPHREIMPVHRSDGSGTTYVFTHYLATEVPFWAEKYSEGTDIGWHEDTLGGDGNEGVTATVLGTPGGLGYVNQAYAIQNDLATAWVVNEDGNAIEPSLEATTIASEVAHIPDNFQFNLDNIGGEGYPIAGANWVLAYACGYEDEVADVLKDFWTWAVDDSQADALATDLGYAPMSRSLRGRVLREIERINSE
ncbi:phosphate ABC transporter substrate-binding protein PstS [Streptomyces sp. 6N223]|uniref:phosphate ABC transporter substrate-binding protein PstS n=1 Tax=Streptomyces sp. 6N223 TaxID=3457412 RepID=UPI003FCFD63C